MAGINVLKVKEVQAAGEGDLSDGGGLFLRIRSARLSSTGKARPGTEAWIFRFTAPSGVRREMGLGPAGRGPGMDAEVGRRMKAARAAAADARELLQRGVDPIEQRKQKRQDAKAAVESVKVDKQRQQLTLARVARTYHEKYIEPRLSPKHSAQWLSSLENHVPGEIWHKPIGEIEAPHLLVALAAVKPHERARNVNGAMVPETLRRIRQRLDAVFEDAIFNKYCTSNPAAAIRRKLRETMPQAKAGQFRMLGFREVPAFMAKVRTAEGISARCLEFALLTAARTSEALTAEWSEFDLTEGTWTIPAGKMKAGEEHVVHLSKQARELVAGQIGLDQVYAFPSVMKPRRPMSNMALLTALDRLGMRTATTVHGVCRATFSTWAYETAAARPDVIEACLAHREADKVKAAYNRAEFATERRALMQAWADYLGEARGRVLPLFAA